MIKSRMFYCLRLLVFFGFFGFSNLTQAQDTSAQFSIAQVIVNSCQGYIELSIQSDPSHIISYQWYTSDDGTENGTFSIIDGETFRVLFTNPGFYKVIVTNTITNEIIEAEYELYQPFDLTIQDLFSGLICNNDANSGAILAYFNNGSSPYTYTLVDSGGTEVASGTTNQGQETLLIENLAVETYTLTWTDSLQCSGTTNIEVESPPTLEATLTTTNPLCFGENGDVTFSVSGGWGADYKVQLLDPSSAAIPIPSSTLINTNDGPYYNIGNGQNINVTSLPAGIYQLKFFDEPLNSQYINRFNFDVTETQSCIRLMQFEIEEPDELIVLDTDAIVNDVNCFGADDGNIQITPTGGTPPYNISWAASNGGGIPTGQGANNLLTNLSPGDYQVTITDVNNCQYTNTYTITQPNQLLLSYNTSTEVSCNGGDDGVIVVEVIEGTPPYSFSINGVTITPIKNGDLYSFSNLTADTYVISVEDDNQCTAAPSGIVQIINEPDPINITINDFELNCFGDSDGVVSGTITGGTAPYIIINDQTAESQTVSFDGGTFNFSSLVADNYTFSITDAKSSSGGAGCIATASADITEPTMLTATASTSDSLCFGSDDGTIEVTATGGTAPYTFSWIASAGGLIPTGQETSALLSGLAAGDYQVTILDDNVCQYNETYTILEPVQLNLGLASFIDVSCNGGNDGSLTVQVSGGTPGYTFSLNGTSLNPNNINGNLYTFSGLSAAAYSLTVTDTNSCASIITEVDQTISEPQVIVHTINDFALACFNDANGVIDGTISGGTAPYTITNNISGASVNVNTDGGSFSFSGLIAGNYTFSITDANSATGDAGCASTASATVTQPTQLTATATLSNVTCYNNSDGSILLNPTGGTGPYYFDWTTSTGTIQAGEETTASLTGLPPGIYDVTISDDNGCEINQSYSITEPNLLQISPTVSSFDSGSGSTINISCNGNSDGFINITPSGGTGPFTYQWSASNGGVVPAGQTSNQNLTGLTAGDYTLTLTDDNNCSTSASLSLIAPRILDGTAIVTQDNSCFDGSLGAIQTTIDNSGSVDGITYTYVLTGTSIPSGYTASEATTQLTQQFENLPAGSYTVTVTDANNCSFTSATQTIVQPSAPITATATTTDFNGFNISCFGEIDAGLSISVSGGTPFIDGSGNPYYTYQWTSPSASPIPVGQETTNSLSGIGVGRYQVVITDGTGSCTLTEIYTITQPDDIVLTGTMSNYNGFEVSGFGLDDGSIDLTVAGGIDSQVYTYLWSASNGGIIPTGQDDDEDLSGLTKGTYTVVVTDANGCTETISFTLTEPNELLVSEAIAQHQNVDCFGDSTGVIQIDITQGSIGPYDFTLSLGGTVVETTNTTALLYRFENLAAGDYTATVTDANGTDVVITNIVISQPASGLAFASETVSDFNGFGISCFGADDGTINLVISGGTPPYTYNWTASNGTDLSTINSPDLNALAPGDYTVVVTDGTGSCDISATYSITQPTDMVLSGTMSNYNGFEVSGFGLDDGSIDLTVAGGIDSQVYTYLWSASNGGIIPTGQDDDEDLSGLTKGTYTVVVTDANGCTETISFTLTEPNELLVSEAIAQHQNVDCFGDSTGVIQIDITQGSIGPYDFTLSLGGTVVETTNTTALLYRFENLAAGDYTATVTDANGTDVVITNIVISQPASVFAASITTSSYTGPNGTFELSCFGSSEGVIDVTLSGGTPFDEGLPTAYYNYIITNSSGTIVTTGQGTTINETNLLADTYTLNATDESGNCAISELIVLTEPNALSITTDLFQDMSCFQADDGAVSVSVSGGLGNYTYNWTKDGNPFATTDDLSALDAGQYVLVIVDTGTNSCSISETYVINEPLGLQVSLDSTTNILCNGASTGAINISVSGGTPFTSVTADYQFNWVHDSGATYITEDLANIPAGTYDLTITDANGCSETLQAILTEPTAVIFNTTKSDISCYGYDDGSITINPTGGVLPYQITWSDLGNGTTRTNLSPGSYTATILDGNNCTYIENITIVDAPIFAINGTKTNISCFGANDGSIDLIVVGGVAPLVLSWNDDPTAGLQRNNLGPGVYDVTITGADGCIQAETYVIDEPLGIQASGVTTDAFDCTDPNSGAIDLTVAGGTLPLRFSWNTGATTEDLTAIPAGNYAVTITDANGCQITENFTIIRQTPLAASVISTIEANCATKDVVQVNELFITGGFPPHTISWSYGNVDMSDQTIMRTSVNGNAVATITDSIGCTTSVVVPVDLLYLGDADFSMNSSFYTDFNIWAINDPVLFTNTSTGDPQSFNWDFGDGNTSTEENPTHAYVNEGTYQITLTVGYPYGCSYSVAYTIIVGRGYEIEMPNAFTPNNDGVNDTFRPVYLGMKEVSLEIYDTWGGLLYAESSTTNVFIGWDGTVNGKPIENGNYIYQLTATARNDLEIQQSGPFTLIK